MRTRRGPVSCLSFVLYEASSTYNLWEKLLAGGFNFILIFFLYIDIGVTGTETNTKVAPWFVCKMDWYFYYSQLKKKIEKRFILLMYTTNHYPPTFTDLYISGYYILHIISWIFKKSIGRCFHNGIIFTYMITWYHILWLFMFKFNVYNISRMKEDVQLKSFFLQSLLYKSSKGWKVCWKVCWICVKTYTTHIISETVSIFVK